MIVRHAVSILMRGTISCIYLPQNGVERMVQGYGEEVLSEGVTYTDLTQQYCQIRRQRCID